MTGRGLGRPRAWFEVHFRRIAPGAHAPALGGTRLAVLLAMPQLRSLILFRLRTAAGALLRGIARALLVASSLIWCLALHLALVAAAGWLVFTQGWWMDGLPGEDIASVDLLHPELRPRVDAVIAELEDQGWEVRVSSAWRSAERQEAIFVIGQLGERLGASPWSRVRGGQSCHNQLRDDGSPGAAAVDLAPGGVDSLEQRAAFYRALGRAAGDQGLRWGGDFNRSNAVWARYDLGWDPAHIEDRALCRRLRARSES